MYLLAALFEQNLIKGRPDLRRDPMNGDTGADVITEVLVIFSHICSEGIIRKPGRFQTFPLLFV